MVRRDRTVWLFALPLLVLLLAMWVGLFAGQSGADPSSFRFAVVADSRSNHSNPSVNSAVLRQLIAEMNSLNPAFCLFPGDLVYGGKTGNDAFRRQLQEWTAATSKLRALSMRPPETMS